MTPALAAARRAAILALSVLVALGGCTRAPSDDGAPSDATSRGDSPPKTTLPSEDDLYAYALAVARQAEERAETYTAIARLHLGRVHRRFQLVERAIATFDEALALDPGLAAAWREKADLHSQSDRMDDALTAYEASLELAPEQMGVRTRIGMTLLHLGRVDEALAPLEEEIRRGATDPLPFQQRGQALAHLGRHGEAVESYRAALVRDPDFREALWGLSQSLRRLGEADAARATLAEFQEKRAADEEAELDSSPGENDLPAQRRWTAATWRDAADLYAAEAATTVDPTTRAAFLRLELEAIEESLRFSPEQPVLWRRVVSARQAAGDTDGAEAVIARAVEAAPGEPTVLFDGARWYATPRAGESGLTPDRLERAFALLDRSIAAAPKYASAHAAKAQLLLHHREGPEAMRAALEHARVAIDAADPKETIHYDILSFARFRNGQVREAIATLRQGLVAFPGDAMLEGRLERLLSRVSPSTGEP